MTPEELDAIEAAYAEHSPECPFPGEKVMDALREAWAELELAKGSVPPDVLAESLRFKVRAERAEAALDRVRAVCDLSEWLNAEARWQYEQCMPLGYAPRLNPWAVGQVRGVIEGPS